MTDTPPVVHTPEPSHPSTGGIKGFLTTDTMGMPNWVWIVVIGGGITFAILAKRFFNAPAQGNATTTGTTPDSGLGLAVDPTTGLPYAVEGLVPSGQSYSSNPPPNPPPPTPTPNPPPPTPVPTPNPPPPTPTPHQPPPPPPQPQAKYVTVQKWPSQLGSLWGIAQQYGLTLARIEQLNPQISNPNLIYPGQQVRIA